MDSLTQLVLGAAIGEATLGKQVGRKAALWGAICGTLPDLDVLLVKDAVSSFTEHRGFSHSLLIHLLITPLLVLLIERIHTGARELRWRWCLLVYLCFSTHALLDAMTIYGTQLLWPLTTYPFGVGSVFIIDPLYTVPLLLGLLIALIWRPRRGAVVVGLSISCVYLAWSVFAQHTMTQRFAAAWQQQGETAAQAITLPMPLNTLLWKNIVITEQGYWLAFGSVLDKQPQLQYQFFANDAQALNALPGHMDIQRLQRFTKGFYTVQRDGDAIWLSDLRMGAFGRFVFNFNVGSIGSDGAVQVPEPIQQRSMRPSGDQAKEGLAAVWTRIWQQDVDLFQYF